MFVSEALQEIPQQLRQIEVCLESVELDGFPVSLFPHIIGEVENQIVVGVAVVSDLGHVSFFIVCEILRVVQVGFVHVILASEIVTVQVFRLRVCRQQQT